MSKASGEYTTEQLQKDFNDGIVEKILKYIEGFQQETLSEAIEGAVPRNKNTPQICPYKLYAEQINGAPFTAPRVQNFRAWFYRILPSAKQKSVFKEIHGGDLIGDFNKEIVTPQRLRWNAPPLPDSKQSKIDFSQGWKTICGSGSAENKVGMAVHIYVANVSMNRKAMCNADGDLLIVPQQGSLCIRTEYGIMTVAPGEICVIQRGTRFTVLIKEAVRGYISEVFENHFRLPDLGPIGSNGLANPRDFQTPTASFENTDDEWTIVQKFLGKLFACSIDHSPFDVPGWHGNYAPYKYNLKHFCAVNSVTYDHMDPSIFTVLTCPTALPGTACCDFVIFPPRWSVHTDTFRPPYYHRNCMSEYMGNIYGKYEAKPEGFVPGGGSLHSCMTPHGPDAQTFEKASVEEQIPVPPKEDALAFMFESYHVFRVTKFSMQPSMVQDDYYKCWEPLKKHFKSKM